MDKAAIRRLIAQSRLDEAIPEMLALAQGSRLENDVQLLSARYHGYTRQQRLGTELPADLERSLNKITHSLLELLKELPEAASLGGGVQPPIADAPPAFSGAGDRNLPLTGTGTGGGIPSSGASPIFIGTGDGSLPLTGTGDGGSPPVPGSLKTAFWFSVAVFAVLLAISLWQPDWARQNNVLFRTLLGLAAAGVAATLPGFLHLNWGTMIKGGGALAAFVLVFLINPPREDQPFTLTVSVSARKPSTQYPDLKNAELWLWHNNNWDKAAVSPDGIADFKNLYPEIVNRRVAIRLKAEFFRAAQDSLVIRPPATTLDVLEDGSLERVYGKVSDLRGNELSGVIVEVENRFDTTDAAGNYELRMPPALQKTHYLLRARKAKFQPFRDEAWPASGPRDFSMTPVGKPR